MSFLLTTPISESLRPDLIRSSDSDDDPIILEIDLRLADRDAVDLPQLVSRILAGVKSELVIELDVFEWLGERIEPEALACSFVKENSVLPATGLQGRRRRGPFPMRRFRLFSVLMLASYQSPLKIQILLQACLSVRLRPRIPDRRDRRYSSSEKKGSFVSSIS
jgi:hypothetical protein